jgi:hypothetical protein
VALTDEQIANIIFNETRSLSGDKIAEARLNIAHAIMNGEKLSSRPATGPTSAQVPKVEEGAYGQCKSTVAQAKLNVSKGEDPTSGATHFNFRKNNWRGDFFGKKIQTQVGPLNNSYPTADLPKSGIYANTYK